MAQEGVFQQPEDPKVSDEWEERKKEQKTTGQQKEDKAKSEEWEKDKRNSG